MTLDLPHQLKEFERAPGRLKADYEDFVVEEEPLYEPSGEGTHTYFWVEKAGLGTMQAVHDLAEALKVKRYDIGYAGLKDARAVTRQWMSVEHADPAAVEALQIPRIQILKTTRHRNKLRLGHLRGNRFRIRVRDTEADRLADFQDALRRLAEAGVPNYFGPQRFGDRGDNVALGRMVLENRVDEVVDLMLGQPSDADHGSIRTARELYEAGKYEQAIRQWPAMYRDERRALKALARFGKKKKAFLAVDKSTRQFLISAYQSHLFNQVVARRLESGLGTLLDGDLAWVHRNGAVFAVENPTVEQPRADAFEISPSGPLFGPRMTEPAGVAQAMEAAVLAEAEGSRELFGNQFYRVHGGRRPLRFRIEDAKISLGADRRGTYLELTFLLPRGSYATCVLRELFREEVIGESA
jgi:tRNA pseudouridine13 synthase